jgi:hypothetical protein
MADFSKKINIKLLLFIIGIIIAILWNFSPLAVFFIIPFLLVLAMFKERKKNAICLLGGFFIVFIPTILFNHYSSPPDVAKGWGEKISNHISSIYTIILDDVTIDEKNNNEQTDKNIEFQKQMVLDSFENKTSEYSVVSGKEYNPYLQIVPYGKEGNCLKISFNTPIVHDVTIKKPVDFNNWKNYLYLTFWIKSEQNLGTFEVIVEDKDGDFWHYFNEELLLKRDWQLVTIPFTKLENPDWSHKGNGRLNLDNVTNIYFNFNSLEGQKSRYIYSIYVDEIYLTS